MLKHVQRLSDLSDNVLPFSSGVLSNFNRCPVTIDNLTSPSSEHAYQWRACTEALCADLAEKVVKAGTPREAKQIAAQVKHDSSSNWHNIKCDVMKEVLSAKMKCSKPFRDALIASGTKVLVEARLDDFWGSGLTYNLTLNTHPDKYPGSNQLGLILSELRHELMSKPTDIDIDDPVIQGQSDTDSWRTQPPRLHDPLGLHLELALKISQRHTHQLEWPL